MIGYSSPSHDAFTIAAARDDTSSDVKMFERSNHGAARRRDFTRHPSWFADAYLVNIRLGGAPTPISHARMYLLQMYGRAGLRRPA
jgi:hypothetical protein